MINQCVECNCVKSLQFFSTMSKLNVLQHYFEDSFSTRSNQGLANEDKYRIFPGCGTVHFDSSSILILSFTIDILL